jgi:hypothetical protein
MLEHPTKINHICPGLQFLLQDRAYLDNTPRTKDVLPIDKTVLILETRQNGEFVFIPTGRFLAKRS